MGDPNRNSVFTRFINKNFPYAKSILVVADGKGELARKLANKGYMIRVIENKPRFVGRTHKNIHYCKGWFDRNTIIEEELIVGMHPDEATSEIIRAAEKQNISWAVVPCCTKGKDANGIRNYNGWITKLKQIGNNCNQTLLKISGKNIILYKHNKQEKSK